MTAPIRPSRTSTLGLSRSQCIHTGLPPHAGASSTRSQAAVATSTPITSRDAQIASRVAASRSRKRLAPATRRPDNTYPAQLGHELREVPGRLVFVSTISSEYGRPSIQR
jgi:hypothetical protein